MSLRRILCIAVAGAVLQGCVSDPRLNTGISIGPNGVAVYPSVSTSVGGARVRISP